MKRQQIVMMGIFLLISRGLALCASESEHPAIISSSPDGKFVVCRQQATSGDLGEVRKTLSIRSRDGKALYEWISGIGTTTALWSPDGKFLAINDTPGERGDLLRLFALNPETTSVMPLRDPDGKKLRQEVETRHGSFLRRIDAATLRASEWKDGRLWCTVTGTFSPKRQPTVHVPFHHLWVYRIDRTNAPVLEQEWTLTDPKERSYRDSSGTP